MRNTLKFGIYLVVSATFLLSLGSCKKETTTVIEPRPEMQYFNLQNREIKANAPGFFIDVNGDGRKDLAFTTSLVGDPLEQVDKLQFLVSSYIEVNLPVNNNEEIPVLNKGQSIVTENFDGYQWFELSSIILVQKITSLTAPPTWQGHWKGATYKYLPYQVITNGRRYNGWVEVSVDVTGEKLILHQAAVSKEAEKTVKAGE